MSQSNNKAPQHTDKVAWTKRSRKAVYKQIGRARDGVARRSPPWMRAFFGPIYNYLDMYFIDHGMFRVIYANRYQISANAWRSSQPWPHQVRYLANKKGVKTILNLRGERDCGSFRLETLACEKHGIELRNDLKVYSRDAPSKETILSLKPYFEQLTYPILLHCKSGADRVGLVSTLYLHLVENVPMEEARMQLSLKYGHFKQAKTGILDYFIDEYIAYNSANNMPFLEWVETVYDPQSLKQSFHSERWSSLLVDRILNRE